MREETAYLKSQPLRAWQFGDERGIDDMPTWVQSHVRCHGTDLILVRRSGDQLIRRGEWLLKHPDRRDLMWCTDSGYRRDYTSEMPS